MQSEKSGYPSSEAKTLLSNSHTQIKTFVTYTCQCRPTKDSQNHKQIPGTEISGNYLEIKEKKSFNSYVIFANRILAKKLFLTHNL